MNGLTRVREEVGGEWGGTFHAKSYLPKRQVLGVAACSPSPVSSKCLALMNSHLAVGIKGTMPFLNLAKPSGVLPTPPSQ